MRIEHPISRKQIYNKANINITCAGQSPAPVISVGGGYKPTWPYRFAVGFSTPLHYSPTIKLPLH
jgi:hypothetical protein